MERERTHQRSNSSGAATSSPELRATRDAAAVARDAAARAAEVQAEPAGIAVIVRTTASGGGGAASLVATPDTSVGEVMLAACRELGLPDRNRYALVADGEVLEEQTRIGDAPREATDTTLTMRLVRRPEAGAAAPLAA
jgi:hypothetical protein